MWTDEEYRKLWEELKALAKRDADDHALTRISIHVKGVHNDAIDEAAIRAAGKAVMLEVDGKDAREIAEEVLMLKRR